MPSVAPMLIDISMSPESSALTCVLSPRNSTTSTSSPYFLKKPFSTATYGVIDSSEGGLNDEPILSFALCASLNEGNANRPQATPVNADFQFMLDLLPGPLFEETEIATHSTAANQLPHDAVIQPVDPAGLGRKSSHRAVSLKPQDSSNSKSSRVRLRMTLLSALMIASARSRLDCCNARTFSSTVSRAISR